MGWIKLPVAASTRIPPTKGAVHEKETSTKVRAIKNAPIKPPLSTCLSDLLVIEEGKTSSNIPKNEAAKKVKSKKNIVLVIQ